MTNKKNEVLDQIHQEKFLLIFKNVKRIYYHQIVKSPYCCCSKKMTSLTLVKFLSADPQRGPRRGFLRGFVFVSARIRVRGHPSGRWKHKMVSLVV